MKFGFCDFAAEALLILVAIEFICFDNFTVSAIDEILVLRFHCKGPIESGSK
jgi:hypothetical protein